jgi:hypothetical protein
MRLLWMLIAAGIFTSPAFAQIDTYPDDPEVPVSPAYPPSPTGGTVPPSPAGAVRDASPLWPADTVPVFMLSCTRLQKEITQSCRCIIDNLMRQMPHNEFVELANAGLIEKDRRYLDIRRRCLGAANTR